MIIRLAMDRDCPSCGYPEMYAEVDPNAVEPGSIAHGCTKCGHRQEADAPAMS